tara:strand:- start:309 stop:446 length:138 start_codon:yes stop_codon:yes gene_type:complete
MGDKDIQVPAEVVKLLDFSISSGPLIKTWPYYFEITEIRLLNNLY